MRKEVIIHQTMTYFKDSEKVLHVLSNYLKDKPWVAKIVDNQVENRLASLILPEDNIDPESFKILD